MKYTFKNGAKIEGTYEQIEKTAKALGETIDATKFDEVPSGYYKSESKGLMKITEMPEPHLRNALIKRSKEYYETLRKRKIDKKEFLQLYTNLTEDKTVVQLYNELAKRK